MNYFIKAVKEVPEYLRKRNISDYVTFSEDVIVYDLMRKRVNKDEIVRNLIEFNGEPLMKGQILPGQVYEFMYKADKATVYEINGTKLEFYDLLPVILCTSVTDTLVRGINLNLCNRDLKAFILNMLSNIDEEFVFDGAKTMVLRNHAPRSPKIEKFFTLPDIEKKLKEYIDKTYGMEIFKWIFRTYTRKKILSLRFLDTWQWRYIPYVEYTHTVKATILLNIYKLTGMTRQKVL